jgi:hypothetical protein
MVKFISTVYSRPLQIQRYYCYLELVGYTLKFTLNYIKDKVQTLSIFMKMLGWR